MVLQWYISSRWRVSKHFMVMQMSSLLFMARRKTLPSIFIQGHHCRYKSWLRLIRKKETDLNLIRVLYCLGLITLSREKICFSAKKRIKRPVSMPVKLSVMRFWWFHQQFCDFCDFNNLRTTLLDKGTPKRTHLLSVSDDSRTFRSHNIVTHRSRRGTAVDSRSPWFSVWAERTKSAAYRTVANTTAYDWERTKWKRRGNQSKRRLLFTSRMPMTGI